jgi:anionic cell wall polymer biosynthesis LytR-Cps2A-Psr (LCP) family protein
MGGQQALEFIRSRHSKDPLEGSDDARAKRQQRVIEGLVDRMDDKDIPRNHAYIGDLLRLYNQDFARFLPIEQVIAMGKAFLTLKRLPTFEAHHFAIQGFEASPIFYHPTTFYSGQWVYLPVDPTGKKIKTVVKDWLQ